MRKKIIITTIAIISITAAIASKNHTPAANTNSIACTADMQKSIAGKILRFHVLANSDSEADQNVKKQVRDAVGAYIEPYLLECENIEETRATVNDHMDEIIAVSKQTVLHMAHRQSLHTPISRKRRMGTIHFLREITRRLK